VAQNFPSTLKIAMLSPSRSTTLLLPGNLEPFCHFDPFRHRRFLPTKKPNSTQTLFSQFVCFKYEIRCKNEMLGFLLRFQSVRICRTLSISHLKRVKGSFP
jgi:hypothetical protein